MLQVWCDLKYSYVQLYSQQRHGIPVEFLCSSPSAGSDLDVCCVGHHRPPLTLFQVLFAVFDSVQGFVIITVHCVMRREVQDAVRCRIGGCKDDSENSPDSCKNGQVQIMKSQNMSYCGQQCGSLRYSTGTGASPCPSSSCQQQSPCLPPFHPHQGCQHGCQQGCYHSLPHNNHMNHEHMNHTLNHAHNQAYNHNHGHNHNQYPNSKSVCQSQ
ncbi:uncharacterized protein [Salvelinus sp. IW2-2015]|uniref:uncharacterized protein n=1 Tax=Salvelinus sp. IW2-2015 TaxID=2691554 RepID=UPI000CEAC706|nr:uncharacterized protein LOC112076530 isoform X1 [Salvelinus alpinus]